LSSDLERFWNANAQSGGCFSASSVGSNQTIRSFPQNLAEGVPAAGVPGRIPHDFRRTAVCNLVHRGIPEKIAMAMVGWKSRQMLDRYNS
jgi:integrase